MIQGIAGLFAHGTWSTWSSTSLMIIFFTYFYTAIVLNPTDLADNMQEVRRLHPGDPSGA